MPMPKKPRKLCECGCGRELPRATGRYFSVSCQMDNQYRNYISLWYRGIVDGSDGGTGVSSHVRRYLIDRFGEKCSKCGWAEVHPTTGHVPIEVDHVDGNGTNHRPENLRLLCPNCHALTPTFRALNKGNGRESRRKRTISLTGKAAVL